MANLLWDTDAPLLPLFGCFNDCARTAIPFRAVSPLPLLVFEFFHGENRDVCFMGIYFHDEILDSIDAVELNEE